LDPPYDGGDRSADQGQDCRRFLVGEVSVLLTVDDVVPGFIQGRLGVSQKWDDLSGIEAGVAFGKVSRSPARSVPDLVKEPEVAANGLASGQAQNLAAHCHGKLVAFQIFETPDSSHAPTRCIKNARPFSWKFAKRAVKVRTFPGAPVLPQSHKLRQEP
jgi:hypothetical protein